MNKKEALEIIERYNLNPPKPTKYYYKDPYDDGKTRCSGWCYKNPHVDPKLIDAILERDKDCKEYIPDSDIDEKFNQEMEKKFTALMNRAKNTAVKEDRKNNMHVYSAVTENNKISDDDDDRKVIDYETMSSICKSLKIQQLKLLHKHIIEVADELYRLSDELDMSDKDEFICKISIIEALKELNHVAEYLSKHTLGNKSESSK